VRIRTYDHRFQGRGLSGVHKSADFAFLLTVVCIVAFGRDVTQGQEIAIDSADPMQEESEPSARFESQLRTSDLPELFDLREKLAADLEMTERELNLHKQTIETSASEAELTSLITDASADLEAKRKAGADAGLLRVIEGYIERAKQDLEKLEGAKESIGRGQVALVGSRLRLKQVDRRLNEVLREALETSRFRMIASISFCVLVGFVILGFFIIAWKKDRIAFTIFAGEKGMQFVTLFLVVIAIILFGILETLEGKELSALLGGLSGFILGRASGNDRQAPVESRTIPVESAEA
jgi:hypothetical protein